MIHWIIFEYAWQFKTNHIPIVCGSLHYYSSITSYMTFCLILILYSARELLPYRIPAYALDIRTNQLRLVSVLFECFHNLLLMLGAECFERDPEFYRRTAVNGYELVVLEFNHITVLSGNNICHMT